MQPQSTVCCDRNESTMQNGFWSTVAIISLLQHACPINVDDPSENIGSHKVLFVPTHLSAIINEGGAADELVGQFGTDLQKFRHSLTRSQVENSTHYHSLVKRQLRSLIVRCCGSQSCMPTAKRKGGRPRPPTGGMGGVGSVGGVNNNNRGTYRGPVAWAAVKGKGMTIACSNCPSNWQANLDFGRGTGTIPIGCPECPDDWRERLGIGPNARRPPEEQKPVEAEYEEEEEGGSGATTEESEYYEDGEEEPTTVSADDP